MFGKSDVYRVNVVDGVGDGVHPGFVFDEPEENGSFPRILKFDNSTGVSSWVEKDDGSEIPNYESPDGDYSDLSVSGVTWHKNK